MTGTEKPTPVTMVMGTHHLHPLRLPQLHTTAPSWQNKLPCMGFLLLHMQQDWTLGTTMPQWQTTSTKECTSAKEFTPNWITALKSRCLPRSHNYHPGSGGKSNAIDVGEDHSPQDEIALYSIQDNVTTVATAHATGNTKEAATHNELFIDAINYGTIRNTHPKEIMVGNVCAPQCNKAYTTVQLPASASRKGTVSLHVKVDTRAGGNVLPLCVF